MTQRPSGVIGVIEIKDRAFATDSRRVARTAEDTHLAKTILRLSRGERGSQVDKEIHLRRFTRQRADILRFPSAGGPSKTVYRTAHLARLASDLSCELAIFRLRLAEFDGDYAA